MDLTQERKSKAAGTRLKAGRTQDVAVTTISRKVSVIANIATLGNVQISRINRKLHAYTIQRPGTRTYVLATLCGP